MFDAYTIKKVIPRLLIAVIAVNLSWDICTIIIDIVNTLGRNMAALIGGSSGSISDATLQTQALFGVGVGGAAIAAFTAPAILLPVVITILSAILVGFVTLALRQIVIIGLVIAAPLALVLWVFPGMDSWAKKWLSYFVKALLMYPMIMALISIGSLLSGVLLATGDEALQVVGIIVKFAPFFAIPFTAKWAGGIMAQGAGLVANQARGITDRSKKFRNQRVQDKWNRDFSPKILQKRADVAGSIQKRASGSSRFGGALLRAGARSVGGYNIEAAMSARNAQEAKLLNEQIATGRDDDIRGLTVNKKAVDRMGWENAEAAGLVREHDGRRQYKSLGGAWVDEANVIEGHRRWGSNQFAQQAALSYELRKAATSEDIQGVADRYDSLATEQWGLTERQAGGNWKGATFEQAATHLDLKHTNWHGQRDSTNFLKEMYEKKGSYPASQLSGHAITSLREDHANASETLAELAYVRERSGGSLDADQQARWDEAVNQKQMAESIARTFSMRQQMAPGQVSDDGQLVGIGNGAGHVNDEISAFVQEVNDTRNVREYVDGTRVPDPNTPRPPTPTGTEGTFR